MRVVLDNFSLSIIPFPENVNVLVKFHQLPPWSCSQELRSYARVSLRRVIRASTNRSEVHTTVPLVCMGSLSLSPVEIALLRATRFALLCYAFASVSRRMLERKIFYPWENYRFYDTTNIQNRNKENKRKTTTLGEVTNLEKWRAKSSGRAAFADSFESVHRIDVSSTRKTRDIMPRSVSKVLIFLPSFLPYLTLTGKFTTLRTTRNHTITHTQLSHTHNPTSDCSFLPFLASFESGCARIVPPLLEQPAARGWRSGVNRLPPRGRTCGPSGWNESTESLPR